MNFYNLETEQYLLAAMFYRNIEVINQDIKADDFASPEHGEIYSEMRRLVSTNGRFEKSDFVLWSEGKIFGNLPAFEYISALCDTFPPDSDGTKTMAHTVKELSRKRKILQTIKAAEADLKTKPSAEIISFLNTATQETIEADAIKSCAEVRGEILKSLELPPKKYPTGLQRLDDGMGGGLFEGFTYGFCGAEKAGKTTLANTISFNIDCPHLYVAMEMGSKQIEQRNIARQIRENSLVFLTDDKSLKNKVETAKINTNQFYIDLPGAALDEVIFHVGTAILKHGIKGFILDYWQLVEGKDPKESEERHLRNVAQALANFARKNKIWCVMLAQMNKEGQLFGGNGIRKACDQLYMIEFCPNVNKNARWLRMDASRYTFKSDIGSETDAAIMMNSAIGPFFESTNYDN